MFRVALFFASLLAVDVVQAITVDGRPHGNMVRPPAVPLFEVAPREGPVVSRNGTQLPPYNQTYWFDQLIDHNNPGQGTFKQRFWHTYEFYEPGGPIILMTPGEINANGYADRYLTNQTINGQIAQQQNGAAIILEHRFYGLSNPIDNLKSESLKLHTIQQAIDDLEYFAKNVVLPQPDGANVTPDKAPWVLVGGSYSGALTSWTMVNKPNLFAAGYASSGVVEAILDFWQYFEPVRENMPKNCSADVQTVITHIDEVFSGSNTTAINEIKNLFGLGDMTHLDDVAGALRNNLWDWQSLQPTSGANTQFRNFCDTLEVKDGVSAPATGRGLAHALQAWGDLWTKGGYLQRLCGDISPEECLGTYDPNQAYYTDTSVDNNNRSWFWIVCNQEGAPPGHPSLVTRLVQPPYDLRQCQFMFPDAFPQPPKVDIKGTNTLYKGWDVHIKNIFFANGIRDPWRDATISAEGLNVASTPEQPIHVGDGFHCSDLSTANGQIDSTIRAVQTAALASMKTWLAAWKPTSKGGHRNATPAVAPHNIPQGRTSPAPSKPISALQKGVVVA
ncbi:Putative serine protease K12H4.7 [Leucoagaricus sp. SymC.cos]|nr:Putative serine protease K12H4.7 [Leucoagaricus sp. SymC.cos]